jgi:GNAT superfamily N-acetyltransferase
MEASTCDGRVWRHEVAAIRGTNDGAERRESEGGAALYTYRIWQMQDLPWLERAAGLAAWETASERERAAATPEAVAARAHQTLRSVLGPGAGTAIIAQSGGEPAGFLLFSVTPDSTTEEPNGLLMTVWVDPRHRRRGVARYLQALAEGILRHMSVRKAKLWTGLHNQPGVAMARQAGFAPEGIIGIKEI